LNLIDSERDCKYVGFGLKQLIPNAKSKIRKLRSKIVLVLRARLELARLAALAPKTSVATNYTISARLYAKKQANLNLSDLGTKV
jgi:hypothetical protein